jgi:1-acyl-sn-glycerol-3-phosphate acyltransferase
MIAAENHPVFTPFWRGYILNSLRGHFDAVRVHVASPDSQPTPTLWHATHVSWWDGYLGVALAQHARLEFRVMMLEENLAKYRFLRFVGAFGVDRGNARGALESIRYGVAELHSVPPRGLLMFPAGDIGSPYARPAPYQPGAASLALQAAKLEPLNVRAVAIRLEHRGAAKPEALLRVSAPRVVSAGMKTAELMGLMRGDLERETDALQADLTHGSLEGYDPILRGSLSVQEGWDAFRRALGVKV